MKYRDPKLRQLLAAEYVLGTLHGAARRRFQRLLAADPALAGEVTAWEARFTALQGRIEPVAPSELVWARLARQLGPGAAAPVTPRRGNVSAARALRIWRAWALAATISSVFLSYALWREIERPPQVVTELVRVEVPQPQPLVALLQPADSGAQWLVAMSPEKGTMKVRMSGNYKMDLARQCLELWVLDDAGTPHSLGELPMQGEKEFAIPKDMPMPAQPTLAVSQEPRGGSPTGLPTGPVIVATPTLRAS